MASNNAVGSENCLSVEDLEGVKSAVQQVIESEDFIKKFAIALNEKLQFQFKETEFKETLCDLNKRIVVLEEENKSLKNELDKLQTKDKKQTLRCDSVSGQLSGNAKPRNESTTNRTHRIDKNKNSSQKYKTKSTSNQIQPSSKSRIPEKYEEFFDQIKTLTINTEGQMQGVIDMLYEKAIDDPNFSETCAFITKELGRIQVPASITRLKNKKEKFVNFRDLLIKKCQNEFEIYLVDASVLKLKETEECTDPEIKNEQHSLLEEVYKKIYNKLHGNVVLIGELFKHHMLSVSIMLNCIHILLENKDENNLECLCTLLNTAGCKLIFARNPNLVPFFRKMQEIVEKNDEKISSNVKCMLQNLIDLRNYKNVPKRQELNSKTMKQTQKEVDTQLNIQIMNSPQKDDFKGSASGSKPPPTEKTLGSKKLFDSEACSSSTTTQTMSTPASANNSKMYALLQKFSDEDKSLSSCETQPNKTPSVSNEGSMKNISDNKNYKDGHGSPKGSEHRTPLAIQQELPVISSAPTPVPAITSVLVPTPVPAPTPASAQTSVLAPTPIPALTSVLAPTPIPALTSVLAPTPVPALTSVLAPTPVPGQIPDPPALDPALAASLQQVNLDQRGLNLLLQNLMKEYINKYTTDNS